MRLITFLAILLMNTIANAQFKADNVKYKTVYPEDLCKALQANPGYVILDVRSQGEFDDTLSSSESLNIGHIKDARHIDIRQLPVRWKELSDLKDKPVFIYCSHSQRSRRASRLLADSGFTKIFNINGGLTDFYADANHIPSCTEYLITQNLPYKIVSPALMVQNIKKNASYVFVDLREDSVFNGATVSESKRSQGHFDAAIHIPFSKLNDAWSKIPANKAVMLIDEFGNESPKAARMLTEKGYKDVNLLFNGMDEWVDYISNTTDKPVVKWTPGINYHLLNADDFYKMTRDKKEFVLIDVRSKDEFNNISKNYWQNIGQIKGAINIPYSELSTSISLPQSKKTPVIVYGFNSQDDIYAAAKLLKDQHYENVNLLYGGIWFLRWASHNLKDKTELNKLVVNVPEENR